MGASGGAASCHTAGVLRPLPVISRTTRSSRSIRPSSRARFSVETTVPPAGSENTPSVPASSFTPSRISASVGASANPFVARIDRIASNPDPGSPIARDSTIVSGFLTGFGRPSADSNPRTIGAHPAGCVPTSRGGRSRASPAVELRQQELRGFERGGGEDVAGDAGLGGRRRGRRGQVARRRAPYRRERPLPGLRDRDRDGAVFERVRRIDGVIFDPNLPCANRTFQVLRSPQRSVTWCEVDDCAVVEHGKELAIPPQRVGPVCQKTALEGGSNRVDLVPNFERPET